MNTSSTPAADALAAARQNMKDLEAAAKAESIEAQRREAAERDSALGKEVKTFQEENYEHIVGGMSEYLGFNGLNMDIVHYKDVQHSMTLSENEGYALYSTLEDILGI